MTLAYTCCVATANLSVALLPWIGCVLALSAFYSPPLSRRRLRALCVRASASCLPCLASGPASMKP